jgi:hypothetical protein
MSQNDNLQNGRGCLGVMAALSAVPMLAIGLGVAATLSMSGCAVANSAGEVVTSVPNPNGAYAPNGVNWLPASEEAALAYFAVPASEDLEVVKSAVKACGDTIRSYNFPNLGQTRTEQASGNANLVVAHDGCMLEAL